MSIEEIMQELDAHNEAIGAGTRNRDKLRRDAEWVQRAREGLTVETLCTCLTDYEFGLRKAKAATKPLLAACKQAMLALFNRSGIRPHDGTPSSDAMNAANAAIKDATGVDVLNELMAQESKGATR